MGHKFQNILGSYLHHRIMLRKHAEPHHYHYASVHCHCELVHDLNIDELVSAGQWASMQISMHAITQAANMQLQATECPMHLMRCFKVVLVPARAVIIDKAVESAVYVASIESV